MKLFGVGDTHFPETDYDRLERVLGDIARHQPDVVVQMGDLYDFYSWSRHPKSLNVFTPKQELEEGRGQAEAFWAAVQQAAPQARCIQLLGNHDDRVSRLVSNKAPELEAVLDALNFHSLWEFPGVETQASSRDEVSIEHPVHGEILFHHGHRGKLGDHVRYNGVNTVVGHSHRGGVIFEGRKDKAIFELNCGFIADMKSKVMQYTLQSLSNSVAGYGLIDDDGPRFVAL